jgi:riboflavin kinase/FMN adenylyltransferase
MSTFSLEWSAYPPPEFTGGAVTIGNFDGVHLGHRALVAAAREAASELRIPTIVVTFDPTPHQVLHPDSGPPRPPLTTLADRAALLQAAGADHVIILRTSPSLLALSPEAFFEDILVRQLGAQAIVEGYDFRFGRARAGTTDVLRTLCSAAGMRFREVSPVMHAGEVVSSSRVRSAIVNGDIACASELLARPYRISGEVVTGAKRGRTIGFPTANLAHVPTVLPGNGVYAARAWVDGIMWACAANIGPNPTFGEDARKVEIHLINFSGDLYGKALNVDFVARLRDTRPFAGVAELIEQLKQDIETAKRIVSQG